MKITILIPAFLILTAHHICAQNSPMQKLTVKDFSIEYTPEWTPDTSGNIGSSFFLYSPLMGEDDTFSENINMIVQLLPDPKMTSEQYMDETLKQMPVYFNEYKLISLDKTKKRKKQCHVLEYSGKMNGFELHFKQFIWVMKGSAYILTYTAEGKSYAQFEQIAIQMMESMKFN